MNPQKKIKSEDYKKGETKPVKMASQPAIKKQMPGSRLK